MLRTLGGTEGQKEPLYFIPPTYIQESPSELNLFCMHKEQMFCEKVFCINCLKETPGRSTLPNLPQTFCLIELIKWMVLSG